MREISHNLTWLWVTQVYAFVKTHQAMCLRSVHFTGHKLHLNFNLKRGKEEKPSGSTKEEFRILVLGLRKLMTPATELKLHFENQRLSFICFQQVYWRTIYYHLTIKKTLIIDLCRVFFCHKLQRNSKGFDWYKKTSSIHIYLFMLLYFSEFL